MGFLPARMSRLLVGGHRHDLERVIETLHAEGAVHIEDYKDPTGTTRIGTPLEAGEKASELLLSVRGLQKALGAEAAPAILEHITDPARLLEEAKAATAAATARAEQARTRVAAIEAEAAGLRPIEGLDIDPSLATTLTTVRVFVGLVRNDPRAALTATGVVHDVQVADGPNGTAVAVVAATRDAAAIERALAESGFSPAIVPAGNGTPADRLAALASERASLESALTATDDEVGKLRDAWGPRLAGLERVLMAEVERTQAPLKFGVTDQTFHLEGWVPVGRVAKIKAALTEASGDKLYIEDLGDAPIDSHGAPHKGDHHHNAQAHQGHGHGPDHTHNGHDVPAASAQPEAHHGTDPADEPPIVLQNPAPAKPYEWMLSLLARPLYNEIDPTKLMLFFFPLFFGLMVGDVAVGIAIIFLGIWLKKNSLVGIGGPAVGKALVAGGIVSVVVGAFIFGEALGIHFVVSPEQAHDGDMSWETILGMHIPYDTEAHGLFFKTGGAEAEHQLAEIAATEAGFPPEAVAHEMELFAPHSHIHLSAAGLVNLGYYSKTHDVMPLLIFSILIGIVHIVMGLVIGFRNVLVSHGLTMAIQEKGAWLTFLVGGGMTAFMWGTPLGWAGVGLAVASVAMLWMGAAKTLGAGYIAVLELPAIISNIASYARLAAIGMSKAGLVVALSALAFSIAGGGVVGWIIYLVGFIGIVLLAVLSAGLQSLRLQFVEFFGKFYQGGGRPYVPFGRRAT